MFFHKAMIEISQGATRTILNMKKSHVCGTLFHYVQQILFSKSSCNLLYINN